MNRRTLQLFTAALAALAFGQRAFGACPNGMVESGSSCIDTYEASLWETTNPVAISLIKSGSITSSQQLINFGAIQRGLKGNDYETLGCQYNGGGCKNLFAVSIPRVVPAHTANYFTAAAACRNSGKRLLSNAEWQAAALGTPDPGQDDDMATQCNIGTSGTIAYTGARTACVSDVGAHDMVGNVNEWVADWGPMGTVGVTWDISCRDSAAMQATLGVRLRSSCRLRRVSTDCLAGRCAEVRSAR